MKTNTKWHFYATRLYSRLLRPIKDLTARLVVKRGRPLMNHLKRMMPLMGISVSIGWVKVSLTFLSYISTLLARHGRKFTVFYLKAATVALQQSIGGHYLSDMTPLGVRIARTKGGKLPRLIPALHRKRIRNGDRKVIIFWLTLFNLYRIIDFPGVLKVKTITDPSTEDPVVISAFRVFVTSYFLRSLLSVAPESNMVKSIKDQNRLSSNLGEMSPFPFRLKAKPFLIPKSTPVVKGGRLEPVDSEKNVADSPLSTSPIGLFLAAFTWQKHPELLLSLSKWCSLTGNTWVLNRIDEWGSVWHRITSATPIYITGVLGRLGIKEEAAGKMRVFAMVDPFTQWVLHPLYRELQQLLRMIPNDGEKDQYAPLWRLVKKFPRGPYFSYDLSAATDRLPISIQRALLFPFLGKEGVTAWANLLVARDYSLTQRGTTVNLRYAVGQPMGALSSWHMLAFTHHAIVQWAAQRAGVTRPGEWFDGYAILGDDIVISNARVAEAYLHILHGLGVQVGLAKSLISRNGLALEFAKRTIYKGKDVSPIPFKEYFVGIQNVGASLDLVRKYGLTLGQYLTFKGFGFKVKSRIMMPLSKLGRGIRHAILAYQSLSIGSDPSKFVNYLAMKSILKSYKLTSMKTRSLIERFCSSELNALEDRLSSKVFNDLMAVVKDYSVVKRDREYYGTTGRLADRQTYFKDIEDNLDDKVQRAFDSLKETVYRTAFLDVIIQVRDVRNRIELLRETEFSPDAFASLWLAVDQLYKVIANLPLPKNLYARVEVEARSSAISSIKRWEQYSPLFKKVGKAAQSATPIKEDSAD